MSLITPEILVGATARMSRPGAEYTGPGNSHDGRLNLVNYLFDNKEVYREALLEYGRAEDQIYAVDLLLSSTRRELHQGIIWVADFAHWLTERGEPVPPVTFATIEQMRHNRGAITAETIAPWIPLLRRYVVEDMHSDLLAGGTARADESQPEIHNTLGNLFVAPHRYPTTLGMWFPEFLERLGITEPPAVPQGNTDTSTLLEGAPVTITLALATELADETGRTLVPAGIETYAADYAEFIDWDRDHEQHGLLTMEELVRRRDDASRANSPRLFMRWMRDQHRGPFAVAAADAAPVITVGQLAHAEPITPAEFAPWLDTFTRWVNEVGTTAAAMDEDWLTNTTELSTLSMINGTNTGYESRTGRPMGFHRLPATRNRFTRWLAEHDQIVPDAATIPQGNTAPTFVFDFDQPMHLWPVEQRRAIFEDVIDWQIATAENGNERQRDYQRTNIGYALVPEDSADPTNLWTRQEWSRLGTFRRAVREGEYTLVHVGSTTPETTVPQGNTRPTVEQFLAFTPEQWAEYREDINEWDRAGLSGHYTWADTPTSRSNLDHVLANPSSFMDRAGGLSYLDRFAGHVNDGTYTLIRERTTTPTEEATITDTTEQTILPIGPDHPDWQRFAQQMADVATRNGMCPEYDRIARLMGLPTRKTQIVTRITLDIPVTIERGNNVDDRTLREAAAALIAQSGSISRTNRTELSRAEVVG